MKLLTTLTTLSLCALALGQDTGGINQNDQSAGTVIKGKAPVAKELLKVKIPKPKSFRLKNGVMVYVLEDHRVPAVRFNLQMKAGSIFEPKPGVASMTASLLTEGTPTRTGQQIAEQTEGIGANLNANAGLSTSTLSTSGLSESTDLLISLLADVLLHPTFPTDRLDRAKYSSRAASAQRRTNPAGMLSDLSAKVFYGGTSYGRFAPTADQIGAITVDDLKAFHDKYYRPNGAILGVTGDVEVASLETKLNAALADWKPGDNTPQLPNADFKANSATHIYLIDRPGSAQTTLQFGALAVRQTDPDYIALTVANRVLGGGSSGRLFQNIRERKGYTYGAYSSLSGGQWPGIWGANANVRTEVTEPAVAEFFKEFDRLQNELVPEEELTRVKRSILGSFALTLESPEGILGRTLELVQNGLPMNYWDTYPARIQAVTANDVQRVAKKYLGHGNIQLFAVGERKKTEEGLAKFGPVSIVDPEHIGG